METLEIYYRTKFRSQTSDNMYGWWGEVGRIREERDIQKKEDAGVRKGGKVLKHCVLPMVCGSGGSKSRLAKAAGAEPSGGMRDEQLHAVMARSTYFEVKMYKAHRSRNTFGSWDVEKVRALVARRSFGSQHVQSTPFSEHFWKVWCWKSARCCGAKHMSKSKCRKHPSVGTLLEVETLKKCMPLWRGAHFEVKMSNAPHVWTIFGSWSGVFVWQVQGALHLAKKEQDVRVL